MSPRAARRDPAPPPYVLTVWQPWADLEVLGIKPVENRTWPVPSTLPQWGECDYHGRIAPDDLDQDDDHGTWRHWPDEYQCPVDLDGPFPFRLWIHAAKRWDLNEWRAAVIRSHGDDAAREELELIRVAGPSVLGALVGSVTVTGCHHADECDKVDGDLVTAWSTTRPQERFCSRWAEPGRYHWTFADHAQLDAPIPLRGRQGLWRLPEGALEGVGT